MKHWLSVMTCGTEQDGVSVARRRPWLGAARRWLRALCLATVLGALAAGGTGRATAADDEAEPLDMDLYGDSQLHSDISAYRRDLAYRLREPMVEGLDCSVALAAFLEADRLEKAKKLPEARAALLRGLTAASLPMEPLAAPTFKPLPEGITLELREKVAIPAALWGYADVKPVRGVEVRIAAFKVDGLQQYGVVVQPEAAGQYPLMLYLHGAAFGVPSYSLPTLIELAARGYVVVAPSLRGEDLFAAVEYLDLDSNPKSEGEIENFDGEVTDALAMVAGARALPSVKPGKFGVMGHSFGGGVGLLVATRSDEVACVVSYDAWFVNPYRYYWDRLRGGANNWLSWEYFLEQPVKDQLNGLQRRSLVHQADRIQAPLLLFMGGAYNGSVFHESHHDLVQRLKALKKPFRYEIIPGGGHNFVLYPREAPAKQARKSQDAWLLKYLPPVKPTGVDAPGLLAPAPATPGTEAPAP